MPQTMKIWVTATKPFSMEIGQERLMLVTMRGPDDLNYYIEPCAPTEGETLKRRLNEVTANMSARMGLDAV